MSTQAIPQIPPRPTRTHDQSFSKPAMSALRSDIPKIPPRPANRRLDRSQSPPRDSFARSPLNEPSFVASLPSGNGSVRISAADLPRRPPSVTLPSLGQEGNEYAEVFPAVEEPDPSPTQTRSVANDLHLHAPKPSLPVMSAKQRVSLVTRTDSNQAAALGIGKAGSDDKEPHTRSLKAKASNLSQNSSGTERPPSSSDNEHGIPEIGQRVPMYPNAGDVQAPSPSPFMAQHSGGAGFHNDGLKPRHHGRRTSARGFEGPPGSYGLHGHGIVHKDPFEQAYYEKHPDLLQKEVGQYGGAIGDGRGQWALSSEDLNKIVRETASRGAGLGTSPAIMGTPTEQIGFLASEEYASRMSSPKPQSDSPQKSSTLQGHSEVYHASESDDVVHVEVQESNIHNIYSDAVHGQSTDSLGPHTSASGEEGGLHDEHGYSAPILASDEVAKDPLGYELQPAVSPTVERHGSNSADQISQPWSESGSRASSRPTSRPASIHGISSIRHLDFDRETHHTPLEDLEEYEPLFPEDNSKLEGTKVATNDDSNRHRPKSRKFPSQDVWEDAPNSLHYTATVSAPQLPLEEHEEEAKTQLRAREGETPEQAFARRQEELAEQEARDADSFLNREKKPWAHKSNLPAETGPGTKQRFPSRDVWEDSPDSLLLETTVAKPQEKDIVIQPDERPATGAAVSHQEPAAAEVSLGDGEGRPTTGTASAVKPQIPARPMKQKQVEKLSPDLPPSAQSASPVSASIERTVGPHSGSKPPIPERSKPQVPARPAKLISRDSSEGVPITKVDSGSSSKSTGSEDTPSMSAAVNKPKPPIPTRPLGSKIAALQGGFMSDLNKRLQLGPQAVKKEEPALEAQQEGGKEKTPLVDARKGRARGPARRAPAKSPIPDATTTPSLSSSLSFSGPSMLWHIHPKDGTLSVHEKSASSPTSNVVEAPAPTLIADTAGQSLDELTDTTPAQALHPVVNDETENDMTGSTGTLRPDEPIVSKEAETSETPIHTDAGAGCEHPASGTIEAYVGEATLVDGDTVERDAT